MTEDKERLISTPGVKVYRRRWYILAVFSLLALYQCTVWNTWGPIVNTVELVFPSWSDSTVSLMANWGPISFLVFLLPTLYISELNLRLAIVLSSGLVFFGSGVRCMFVLFPGLSEPVFTGLCHFGAILNGIPGIVVTSIPPAISATWFPPEERVTATSISQMLNNIGTAVSFIMATVIVPETPSSSSGSDGSNSSCHKQGVSSDLTLTDLEANTIKKDVEHYLLILMVPAAVIFSFSIIYFPCKPPQPPSLSSTHQRLSFVSGVWELVKTPAAWIIALVWAIPQAIWNNWCAMMVISLTKIGEGDECLTEKWVNILGIVAILVGTVIAILVGMLTDKIKGFMKATIFALLTIGGVLFTLLSLVSIQAIVLPTMQSLKISVYSLLLLGNSMVVSTSPLCMEFAVEKLYPVPEGIVGGWLNIWYNIISVIFLCIFNIPGVGTDWLNYVLPFSCFSVLPLLLLVKEEYKRRGVDEGMDEVDTGRQEPQIQVISTEALSQTLIL